MDDNPYKPLQIQSRIVAERASVLRFIPTVILVALGSLVSLAGIGFLLIAYALQDHWSDHEDGPYIRVVLEGIAFSIAGIGSLVAGGMFAWARYRWGISLAVAALALLVLGVYV